MVLIFYNGMTSPCIFTRNNISLTRNIGFHLKMSVIS